MRAEDIEEAAEILERLAEVRAIGRFVRAVEALGKPPVYAPRKYRGWAR